MNQETLAPETVDIKYGLTGVVVDKTAISKVMQETNSLTYRGYPVQELAKHCSFEDVVYLLWNSELPNAAQSLDFQTKEVVQREVSRHLLDQLYKFPETAHPMDTLRTSVSLLALEDAETDDSSVESSKRKSLRIYAKLPTIVATLIRKRKGLPRIAPNSELDYCSNFFYMCFGKVPNALELDCFKQSMVLYAEHSFNASTFTGRVVMSTESDIYSAVTAAIGALKGPLHGGANEAVMHNMLAISKPENAKPWLLSKIAHKEKIMGFGHRVYKLGDSRVPSMRQAFFKMAELKGDHCYTKMYEILEEEMLAQKNLHPNLDFPAGPAYYLMGFDIDFFTPLFVMARISGWCAHFIEQQQSNQLIRPLSDYNGPSERHVKLS